MSLLPLGLLSQGGGGGGAGAFEQIATVFGTGSSGTITFSSIPATYKHLQIRATPRSDDSNTIGNLSMRINGDTAANYSWHFMQGYGTGQWSSSGSSASLISLRDYPAANFGVASAHGTIVVDLLDYSDTNKNKTVRAFSGLTNGISQTQVSLMSGNWRSTSAVTSLTMTAALGSFVTASRFSLYGIKG
jgi:hypothetical protein